MSSPAPTRHDHRAAVALVVRDAAMLTLRALVSLSGLSDEEDFHTIVVDDASRDATATVLAGVEGDITALREESPRGFAAGCDRALGASDHDIVVLLREDLVPTRRWLTGLIGAFADPAVGAARPRVLDLAGQDVRTPSWPCLAVRRAAYDAVGGMRAVAQPARPAKTSLTDALAAGGWTVPDAPASLLLTVPEAASRAAGLLEF